MSGEIEEERAKEIEGPARWRWISYAVVTVTVEVMIIYNDEDSEDDENKTNNSNTLMTVRKLRAKQRPLNSQWI